MTKQIFGTMPSMYSPGPGTSFACKDPFETWVENQNVGDDKAFVKDFTNQMMEFRQAASFMAFGLLGSARKCVAYVVGLHTSKSISLPVVLFARPDLGLHIMLRDNFHDIKLSVFSEKPIDDELFPFLFYTTPPADPAYTGNPLADCYFEGFPKDCVLGYQSQDHNRWSAMLGSWCDLHLTLLLCMKALGAVQPLRWASRAGNVKKTLGLLHNLPET